MKKLFFFFLSFLVVSIAFAQNPVSWSFASNKVSDNEYVVTLKATMQPGWHLYSQNQPEDAIAIPTSFNFNSNPLLTLNGKTTEVGKMQQYKDPTLGVTANQYSNEVVFLQKIKVKGKAKTNVTGKLEYQTCDDKKCLPPKTVNFSIALK